MQPYYQDSHCTIYHGDCREILPTLEPVDLVLTDPPYGLNWSYGTYDDAPENLAPLLNEVIARCKELSNLVASFMCILNFESWPPFDWLMSVQWNTTGSYGKFGVSQWCPVALYGKDVRGFGAINGMIKGDVITINGGGGVGFQRDAEKSHPCPKPITMIKPLVQRFTSEGGIVLDPFMGSGTTLVAAKNLGRKAIGIEICEQYCEVAAKRLAQEVLPFSNEAR